MPILAIVVGLIVVWAVMSRFTEPFVPEFLDKSSVKRTSETKDSSYEQQTNHSVPQPGPNVPIDGVESPFRVNAFNAFIP